MSDLATGRVVGSGIVGDGVCAWLNGASAVMNAATAIIEQSGDVGGDVGKPLHGANPCGGGSMEFR